MREIKFRVWDKFDKKMYPVHSIKFNEKHEIERFLVLKEENGTIYLHDILAPFLILLQYTGLKDYNIKEIYEGDIVKFNGQICKVAYVHGAFSLVLDDYIERPRRWDSLCIDNVIPLCEVAWNCSDYEDLIFEVEVIGNIYENPELLEKNE